MDQDKAKNKEPSEDGRPTLGYIMHADYNEPINAAIG